MEEKKASPSNGLNIRLGWQLAAQSAIFCSECKSDDVATRRRAGSCESAGALRAGVLRPQGRPVYWRRSGAVAPVQQVPPIQLTKGLILVVLILENLMKLMGPFSRNCNSL